MNWISVFVALDHFLATSEAVDFGAASLDNVGEFGRAHDKAPVQPLPPHGPQCSPARIMPLPRHQGQFCVLATLV